MKERYKCYTCHTVVGVDIDEPCPLCGEKFKHLVKMCPRDHCNCTHEVMTALAYCPDCGAAMCPECGSHDVAQISRVTGYLQDVAGWNPAKRQELKDRHRVNL
jgi:anaerobic ribonucleoside-triphosphate reductase